MRIVNKEIEVIALCDKNGAPRPYRFRIENDEGAWVVYHIKSVLYRNKEKYNKTTSNIIVGCEGEFDGIIKEYELKYEVQNTKWLLYRI